MILPTFEAVIKAAARHVEASGHQNIVAADDPQAGLAGYICHDCPDNFPDAAWSHWVAPVATLRDLPKAIQKKALTTLGRIEFVREIIKKAMEPKAPALYRPTVWERVLKA